MLLCGLPWWLSGKEFACQCRRPGFHPWAGKIPGRRAWQPIPVFLPGKSHGQRSLVGYSPWVSKEPGKTEQFNNNKCCVGFRCTAKWFSYTCVSIPFPIFFPFRLLQNIEQSSLCYTVGPCWLSIFNVVMFMSIPKSQFIPPLTFPPC